MGGEAIKSTNYKNGGIKTSSYSNEKKKGARGFSVFRAAMTILRKKKNEKKKQMNADNNLSPLSIPTNDALSRFVGSVRPLHLQGNVGGSVSPPPPPPMFFTESLEWGCGGTVSSPGSEVSYPSPSSSQTMSSMYASCQSLYDLGLAEEERMNDNDLVNEDVDAYYDGVEGDEFIDSKAEMFIAQFYKQMKLPSD